MTDDYESLPEPRAVAERQPKPRALPVPKRPRPVEQAQMPRSVPRYTQYKVIAVTAAGAVAIMSGHSGLAIKKLEKRLNREVAEGGWQVVNMVIERQRFMLFWQREAMVVTLGR